MVQPCPVLRGAERPLARVGIPYLRVVVDAGHLVLDFAAASRKNLTVGKDRRVDPHALGRKGLRGSHDRRTARDVDDSGGLRRAAELQNSARAEHCGTGFPALGVRELTERSHHARSGRVDVVHVAFGVVAEHPAVRRDEIARKEVEERAGIRAAQQSEDTIRVPDLRVVFAAGTTLDVGIAAQQCNSRGVPAWPCHVVLAGQRVVRVVEDIAVVVRRVRRRRAGPVVSAGDEHPVAGRQDDLGTAENVRSRVVGEREMPRVESRGRVPDVIDECSRLLAGCRCAVGQYATIGHQYRVDGNERPRLDGRPRAEHVAAGREDFLKGSDGKQKQNQSKLRDAVGAASAHRKSPLLLRQKPWCRPHQLPFIFLRDYTPQKFRRLRTMIAARRFFFGRVVGICDPRRSLDPKLS